MVDQTNLKQFNEIYNDTYGNILKYVICNCSNIDDVNDIIQDIYLDLFKSMSNKNIDDINKYIFGIAKNKIKKHYTLLYKIRTISIFNKENNELIDISDNINIEKEVINKYDIDTIWRHLKTKKLIINKIFYLYYNCDLTIKQISEELEVKESYVKNCLYRTLTELQNTFGKDCD